MDTTSWLWMMMDVDSVSLGYSHPGNSIARASVHQSFENAYVQSEES